MELSSNSFGASGDLSDFLRLGQSMTHRRGHFGVIPGRDDIRTLTQDQMKVIGENREAEQIDPEVSC